METCKNKVAGPSFYVKQIRCQSMQALLRYQRNTKRMQTGGSVFNFIIYIDYIDYILIYVCMCVYIYIYIYIYLYNVFVGLSSSSWGHTTETTRNNIKGSVLIIHFISYMPGELTRADLWPCMFSD